MGDVKEKEYTCIICGEPLGYIPRKCCDGVMCGCMGEPIDPPICSEKCYNIMILKYKEKK